MTKTIERPGFTLPGIEDITRRDFLVGGAATLLLAGCGSGSGGNEPSGETRTVESPMGPVELPENPERLVAMYATDVDVALVLDLPLVGGGTAHGLAGQPFASYQPKDRLKDVERLGTFPEANYEQIASVQPDCIIDSTTDDREQYERLSEIAATYNFNKVLYGEGSLADWRRALRNVAAAFERESRAEQVIAEYEERAENLRERLAERWSGATFAVVGGGEPGTLNINYLASQPLIILSEELGLAPADFVPETYEDYMEEGRLSLERIDLLREVDLIFVRVEVSNEGSGRDRAVINPMLESLLWQRLPAVENGQIHEFDAELFYASPLTAEAFLDVVEESLLS